MRVLFTFLGGWGHFEPLAPVAHAVRRAGHEVAVACGGTLVPRVEATGLRALATSAPRPPAAPRPRDPGPTEVTDARAAEVEFATNFVAKGARRHATALPEHLAAFRPDVVVRDEADLGALVAAEVAGIPTATVLVLASGMLVRPELVGPPLAEVRAEHGLPPDPGLAALSRGPVLTAFPPSLRDPRSPVPLPVDTHHFRSGTSSAHPGRRAVYVTLGTVFNRESGDLFERLLAGVATVDADVLVTVGRDVDPAELGPQPGHVRVEQFVPQAEVLASTALVVSHGGSGSLLAALAHGVPSVLLPLGADQPHNAVRAAELGVARVLDAATASPGEIASTVTAALTDDDLARAAGRVADEVAALPPVDEVVAVLEGLARVGSSPWPQDSPAGR